MTTTPVQVRFSDVDLAGHLHNAVYLQFFEQGRMDFFHQFLTRGSWDWSKQSLILAKNVVNYKSPVYLHDKIHVETTLAGFGTKSITLSYRVKRDDTICAEGESVLVCFDYQSKATIEIPATWRKALEAYQAL